MYRRNLLLEDLVTGIIDDRFWAVVETLIIADLACWVNLYYSRDQPVVVEQESLVCLDREYIRSFK